MRRKTLIVLILIVLAVLTSCSKITEDNESTSTIENMTEPSSETDSTAGKAESEMSSETTVSAEYPTTSMEEVPDFLAELSDAVYLNPFSPAEWQVWDEELGFKLCSLYIDGEKHRALYREDGLVIIETVITAETDASASGYRTYYDYRVKYGDREQCVSMNEGLSALNIIFTDMDDDGDDELLFYTWQRDVDGYGACLYIMRFPTLELVEIDYSEEFLNSVIVDYGISSVEIPEESTAVVVTFYVCDNKGNRYEGVTGLSGSPGAANSGISYDWDYDMELFQSTGIHPVYGSGGFTRTIEGNSTFHIWARHDGGYCYAYVGVNAVISYNALEDRFETEELILSWVPYDEEQPWEIVIPVE